MVRLKIDVCEALKQAGYSSYKIREEGIFGQAAFQRLRDARDGKTELSINTKTINTLCLLLQCQPGDFMEWVPDNE